MPKYTVNVEFMTVTHASYVVDADSEAKARELCAKKEIIADHDLRPHRMPMVGIDHVWIDHREITDVDVTSVTENETEEVC